MKYVKTSLAKNRQNVIPTILMSNECKILQGGGGGGGGGGGSIVDWQEYLIF